LTTVDFTSVANSIPRNISGATGTGANIGGGFSSGDSRIGVSTTTGCGGGHVSLVFGIEETRSDSRCWFGVRAAGVSTFPNATVDPSSYTACVGVAADAADSNLQLMHNDSTGTCTKVDLGANFPAKSPVSIYRLDLSLPAGSTNWTYTLTDLQNRAHVATGTTGTTNVPVNGTIVAIQGFSSNGPTGGTNCKISHGRLMNFNRYPHV
jgi:hypothetical protein